MLGWMIIHIAAISIDGLTDDARKSDCILILGNKVNEDGTLSERLKARLDKGLELYKNGLAPEIMVSGGLGKEGFYEGTEMRNYLVKNGIKQEHVIIDNEGNTTLASAINYKKIADEHTFNSVIVVSQFYHISRTKKLLKKQDVTHIYAAHADYFELRDVYSLFREFFAYYNK
jgi:vancomycin permeability regulator SanA